MSEYLDRLLVGIEVDNNQFKKSIKKAEATFKEMEGRFQKFATSLKDMKIDKQLEKANAALEKTKNAAKNATSELDKMQHLKKVEEMLKGIINEAKKSDDISMVTQKLKELQSVYKQMTNLGIKNEDAQAVKKYNKALIETKEELKKIADSQKEENKRIEEKEKLQKKLKAISFHEQIAEVKKANREYSEQIAALKEVYNRQKQLRTMAENQGNVTQIRKYNDQMDITKQKLKEATEAYEKQNAKIKTNSQRLNSNQQELNQTAVSMRELSFFAVELATLFGLGFGIDDMIRDFTSFSREFDRGIREVFTLTTQTEEEFKGLRNQLVELGKDVPFLYQDLTKAAYWAVSSGVDVGESMMFLEEATRAAMAGVSDLYTSVDALTTVMNAWEMTVDDLADINDTFFMAIKYGKTTFDELAESIGVVAPYAAQTGVAFKEVTTAMAALTRQGLDTKMAATSIARTLGDIIKPSKQAAELAQILGIEYNTTALNAKGLVKFLEDLKEAVGDNMDIITQYDSRLQDTNQALNIFFDRIQSMRGVLALTGSANDEWNKFLAETNEALKEADESMRVTEVAAKKMEGSIENLENSIKNNYHAIILNNKGLEGLYKGVLKTVNAFLEFNANLEGSSQFFYNMVGAANSLALVLPVLIGLFKRLATVLNISTKAKWLMGITTTINIIIQAFGVLISKVDKTRDSLRELDKFSLTNLRDSMEQLNSYLDIMDKDVQGLIKHYNELIYQMEAYNESAKTGKGNISDIENSIKDILEMYPELNSFVRTEKGLYVDIKDELDEIKNKRIEQLETMKIEAENLLEISKTYKEIAQNKYNSMKKISSFEFGNTSFIKSIENAGYTLKDFGDTTEEALRGLYKQISKDMLAKENEKTYLESLVGTEEDIESYKELLQNSLLEITSSKIPDDYNLSRIVKNYDDLPEKLQGIISSVQEELGFPMVNEVLRDIANENYEGLQTKVGSYVDKMREDYFMLSELATSTADKISGVFNAEQELFQYESQIEVGEKRIKAAEEQIQALVDKEKASIEELIKEYKKAREEGDDELSESLGRQLISIKEFEKDYVKLYQEILQTFAFSKEAILRDSVEKTKKDLDEAFKTLEDKRNKYTKEGEGKGLSGTELEDFVETQINTFKKNSGFDILEKNYQEFVNRSIEYYEEAYSDLADQVENDEIVGEGNFNSVINKMTEYRKKIQELKDATEGYKLDLTFDKNKLSDLEKLYDKIQKNISELKIKEASPELFDENEIKSSKNNIISQVKELYLMAKEEGNIAMQGMAKNIFEQYRTVFKEADIIGALEDTFKWATENELESLEKDVLRNLISEYEKLAEAASKEKNIKEYEEYIAQAKEYSNLLTGILNKEERAAKISSLETQIAENKELTKKLEDEEQINNYIQERINMLQELSILALGSDDEKGRERYRELTKEWKALEEQIIKTKTELPEVNETQIADIYKSFLNAYNSGLSWAVEDLASQLKSKISSSLTEMESMMANKSLGRLTGTSEFQSSYSGLLKILEDVEQKTSNIETETNRILSQNKNLIDYYLSQNASLEKMNELYQSFADKLISIKDNMIANDLKTVELDGTLYTIEEIDKIIEGLESNIIINNKAIAEGNRELERQKYLLEQEANLFNQITQEIAGAFGDMGVLGDVLGKILNETKLDVVEVTDEFGKLTGYSKELSILGEKFNLDEVLELLKNDSGDITFDSMVKAFKDSEKLANGLSNVLSGISGILASWGISQVVEQAKNLYDNFNKAKEAAKEMRKALDTARDSETRTDISKKFSLFGDLEAQEEKIKEMEEKMKKLSGDKAIRVGASTGVGAFLGAIFAGPLGALIGAGAGALLGNKATESYQKQIEQLEKDSEELIAQLEDLKQKIKESLSIDIESLSNTLAGAFDENSYNSFLVNWEKALKEKTQNALLQAFISTNKMQSLLAPLSETIFKMATDVAEDGKLDNPELKEELTTQGEAVASMMKAFYEILKELDLDFDFGGLTQTGSIEGGTETLSTSLTEETGNKLLGTIRTITAHTRDIRNMIHRVITGQEVFHVRVVKGVANMNDYTDV